jgi:hypothetical protein
MWLLPQYPETGGYEDEECQTEGQKLHMKMAYWYVMQNPAVGKHDTKESNSGYTRLLKQRYNNMKIR